MKRILSLLVLAGSLTGAAYAATVTGTVYYGTTTTPAAGQIVNIVDTTGAWHAMDTTDAAGHYSFTVPSTVPSSGPGSQLNLWVVACGQYNRAVAINSGAPVVDFAICTSPTYNLHGTVTLGGSPNTDSGIVYLIRKAYDTVLGYTTLVAIDSIYTDISGNYNRTYSTMPSGTLLVKAALLPAHPSYANYLPTYYTSALNWSGATALSTANLTGTATNVSLIGGTNPGGPAFVGGSVLMGANKSTGVGDPLSKRILILTKSTGEAVGYVYSDANGKFQFPSLPYGSYKISGDAAGKANPELSFTLSAATPRIDKIVFQENSTSFEGHIVNVGVTGTALAAVSAYPNPATTEVRVRGLESISGSKTLILSSATGALISRQVTETGNAVISTAHLAAGIYILQVQTAQGNVSFRIAK